jgi:hypothetical protein
MCGINYSFYNLKCRTNEKSFEKNGKKKEELDLFTTIDEASVALTESKIPNCFF